MLNASITPAPASLSLHVVSLKPDVCQFRVAVVADAEAAGQLHPPLRLGPRSSSRPTLPRQAWLVSLAAATAVAPIS